MKKVIKPSDWPKAEKWLEEMKGIGGVKNVSIPRRSIDTVTFATPPTCASVEIDKIRSVFKGTDTVSLEKHVSSAETLIPDEFTRVQSPEMHFLLEAAEGREEIDGYQIVRLLGQGGNNAVFKVRKGGETYILKVPLYAGNYFRDKMGNERRLLSGIHGEITDKLASGKLVNSPNIIKQHTFKEGDLTYIVLELLEKEIETDRKTKDAGKKVSAMDQVFDQIQGNPVRIAVFLWDVLHALEFMHSLNIVHRDVKP
ncbi:MAG: hypothetical protein NTW67_01955, partial [Candidatus Woesearchaeota archaeon]|nr:hypothetical protein [Candidatus Woesearchaeota archaeon]